MVASSQLLLDCVSFVYINSLMISLPSRLLVLKPHASIFRLPLTFSACAVLPKHSRNVALFHTTVRLATNGASKQEMDANQGGDQNKKTYHKQATGEALKTAQNHSAENDLKLYGSCFCPFVHRVWISLEYKGLDYQYVEVDVCYHAVRTSVFVLMRLGLPQT